MTPIIIPGHTRWNRRGIAAGPPVAVALTLASLQLMKSLAMGGTVANMNPPAVPQITRANTYPEFSVTLDASFHTCFLLGRAMLSEIQPGKSRRQLLANAAMAASRVAA
jgi:hypothetical protein